MNPSYEYELLHQFEVVFRDGEHKTQAATRDYSKVWENVIDNPPDEGVTPVHVYRMNGTTCAVIAGMDELVENEECAMEIARLAALASQEQRGGGAMKAPCVWVIEMEDPPKTNKWWPCMGMGLDRAEASRELADWSKRNPSDSFRVRKYVRVEPSK